MRIIAGLARGLPLTVPNGGRVRPTADRVRGAIFSSLGDRVVGAAVLDLFAGCGALGLEAASRGARAVTFVERDRRAQEAIERNLAAFRRGRSIPCELRLCRADVTVWLRRAAAAGARFDLVLADPPYGTVAEELLRDVHLPAVLAAGGWLVLESGARQSAPAGAAWRLCRELVYGDTRVSFLQVRKESQDDESQP